MVTSLSPAEFLEKARTIPVIDVRSPNEFFQGHIPGSFNIPLFNNEERAIVGTLYKNSGREASVFRGLELAGPKLSGFIRVLRKLVPGKEVMVHCWRGGMRSESMAWLFSVAGYTVWLLEGGYKAYRRTIREALGGKINLVILGGNTGSGKTGILKAMAGTGEQVLDLEGLARHKGSVYGGLGLPDQPTTEQFENDIWHCLEGFDLSKPVWTEDESRKIGIVNIPDPLYDRMHRSVMIRIGTSRESRIDRLVSEYSGFGNEALKEKTSRIAEKLGGTTVKIIHEALDRNDFSTVVQLVLDYYDKAYEHAVSRRPGREIHDLPLTGNNPLANALIILGFFDSLQPEQYMPYGTSLS